MPPTVFDQLQRASFSGVEYPVESVRVKGGLRYHVHEYPHIDGGDLEKLGRRLYEFEMRCTFQTVYAVNGVAGFGSYGAMWPGRLALLRSLFDAQTTATLVIPTIGGINACCIEWDQDMVAKMRSGEAATFKFIEDKSSAFAFKNLVQVKTPALDALAQSVEIEFDKAGIDKSLTDQLLDAVNIVLAVFDQAELFGLEVAAKIQLVADICNEFDKRIDKFQNPANWVALDAMKNLWAASQSLAGNVDGNATVFAFYEVKKEAPVSAIATAIYGDTSRAMELLQLNAIENAFAVPVGTLVRYQVPQDQQKAA